VQTKQKTENKKKTENTIENELNRDRKQVINKKKWEKKIMKG